MLWCESAGAHTPQIHSELAGQSDDGFFARCAGGELPFAQSPFPFAHRAVVGLETDQSPGQFHQGCSESGIAVFGDAALQSFLPATVFAGTKPGIAGDLPPIVKAMPVADLPIDDDRSHFTQPARRLFSSGVLQLQCELGDLLLQYCSQSANGDEGAFETLHFAVYEQLWLTYNAMEPTASRRTIQLCMSTA